MELGAGVLAAILGIIIVIATETSYGVLTIAILAVITGVIMVIAAISFYKKGVPFLFLWACLSAPVLFGVAIFLFRVT